MQIISQGKKGILNFIHPDYLIASPTGGRGLNLFDNIWTPADIFFIIFLVAISGIVIGLTFYFIRRWRRS